MKGSLDFKLKQTIKLITGSQKADLFLDGSTPEGQNAYRYFNKHHSFFKIIKNKTHGVALLKLPLLVDDYLVLIRGKNSASYYCRVAEKRSYTFAQINPNQYIDDIYIINTSTPTRQGKPMSNSYIEKIPSYPTDKLNQFYGVFKEGQLVAYVWMKCIGQVWSISRILGHAEYLSDGIMYLLLVKTICKLISDGDKEIIMYDTFLGNSKGITLFKKRIGFTPYKIRWILINQRKNKD